ncbi:hypothetical protein GC173_07185 [bacterium]|nr:hypothetical protein [bacterium]
MFPLSVDPAERRALLAITLLALAEALILFVISFSVAGNHFMFPLDDAYIHLQYARMLAHGDLLVYTPGAMPSGGMTSPLFVALLAPLFVVGVTGTKAAFASFALGAGLWALANVWLHQIARRKFGDQMAVGASVLMLTNGHLLWNFLSGMETGLVALLLLGVVASAWLWWHEEKPGARLALFAFLALLPLARPEGAVAIIALGIVILLRRGERPRLSLLTLALCAVPFVLWLATLRIGTGDWRPAGVAVKSLAAAPVAGWAEKLGFAAQSFWAIQARFLFNVVPDDGWAAFVGTETLPYFPPGFGLLILAGFGLLVMGETRSGKPGAGLLLALLWLGTLGAACTGLFTFAHHQRYLAPATPLAILMGCAALRRLAQLFQQLENTARRAMILGLALASLPSLAWWAVEHGRNSRDLYNVLREASFRIEPDRTPLGITDAGILAFYTSRETVDLVGLTTASFAKSTLHGPGATLEALSRLPQEKRPAELATYRPWFDEAFPLQAPRWTVTTPRTTSAWGNVLGLYPIDWEQIDRSDVIPLVPGARLLAAVDVADLASEAAASYEPRHRAGDLGRNLLATELGPSVLFPASLDIPTTATLTLPTLVDGGRVLRGERFTISASELPKGNLLLVGRVAPPRQLAAPTPYLLQARITAVATGYSVERPLSFPETPDSETVWDLGPVLDEVGGVLSSQPGRWMIEIAPDIPSDAAWTSCHWWVFVARTDD